MEFNPPAFPGNRVLQPPRLSPHSKPVIVPTPGMDMLDYVAAEIFTSTDEESPQWIKAQEMSMHCYQLAEAFLQGRMMFYAKKAEEHAAAQEQKQKDQYDKNTVHINGGTIHYDTDGKENPDDE